MQVQNNPSPSQSAAAPAGKLTPPSVLTAQPATMANATGAPVASANVSPAPPKFDAEAITKQFDLKPNKKAKNASAKKQIPTVIGLLILFVALISGVLLFGQGTGVFAPRATPETTPKNIRVSNITDKTFTVSFYTDESTVAFIKYGLEANSLKQQASDDRDQLSGIVKDYRLHHLTVRGLEPGTTYYYVLGTGSNNFDNEGQPYVVSTAARPNQSPTTNQTVYGNVFNASGQPAEGAIVYLYNEQIGGLSSIVKASGSFGISLSNAFNTEQTAYANLSDEDALEIKVQGIEPNLMSNLQTTVALAQPVPDLVLGQAGDAAQLTDTSLMEDKDELLADPTATDEAALALEEDVATDAASVAPGALDGMLGAQEQLLDDAMTNDVLDLDELDEEQAASTVVVTTTTPQIKATLPPNTVVRVTVHSDTQIDETMQTDAEGNLILDLASLGQSLEPGEHTASYSYIDPVTGEEITRSYNFTVEPDPTRQLAQANLPSPSPTTAAPSIPYGSGNPYVPGEEEEEPVPTASPTASASPSPVSSAGATVATTSGQYNSGSFGTTLALLFAGLFFVAMGVWSYLLSRSFEVRKN
jgi:hypothetical protein